MHCTCVSLAQYCTPISQYVAQVTCYNIARPIKINNACKSLSTFHDVCLLRLCIDTRPLR